MNPDHFDTCNNPAGTHLCHCICCAMLQFTNDDPNQCRKYSRSHLILPRGAQYNDRLFPMILEPRNHRELLMDSSTKEPFPMELVLRGFPHGRPDLQGMLRRLPLLYCNVDLHQLRQWGIHLPVYQGEIPVPPALSYQQARETEVTEQPPPGVVTPNPSVESPKPKHSSGKGGPHRSSRRSSQHLNSKAPRLHFSQEALLFQRANLRQPGEVSPGSWLSQAWPFPFPICQVIWMQTERCSLRRLLHAQLHPSRQFQRV